MKSQYIKSDTNILKSTFNQTTFYESSRNHKKRSSLIARPFLRLINRHDLKFD